MYLLRSYLQCRSTQDLGAGAGLWQDSVLTPGSAAPTLCHLPLPPQLGEDCSGLSFHWH